MIYRSIAVLAGVASNVVFGLIVQLPAVHAQSVTTVDTEKKGYKFTPVEGEDWPASGEVENRTPDSADGSSYDSTPNFDSEGEASRGMPKLKTLPDGSLDLEAFKGL